jgi:hypothetical protein
MTQTIEDHALSPLCSQGQHAACPHQKSYMADDGAGRTLTCNCRCHAHAPETGPQRAYLIAWEYEYVEPAKKGPGDIVYSEEMRVWLKREVVTTSNGVAADWLDALLELAKTNSVRGVSVRRSQELVWEDLKG